MKKFTTNFLLVKEVLYLTLCFMLLVSVAKAQTNQAKAEKIVIQYSSANLYKKSVHQNSKFKPIEVLRSPIDESKTYKILLHKNDSLKMEGKRIDARIAKIKTPAKLEQAKKDSYRLSKELQAASDQLVDFIASYKGQQTGWLLQVRNPVKNKKAITKPAMIFYLDREISRVDSVR